MIVTVEWLNGKFNGSCFVQKKTDWKIFFVSMKQTGIV